MSPPIRDFTPLLLRAIGEARAAGVTAPADALEAAANGVYTTSTEFLAELRGAIQRFLTETRGRLPAGTERKVRACLNEAELASPGFTGLFARWRRPRTLD